MNLPWVQQMSATLPWRRAALFIIASLNGVQVGCAAPIGPVPRELVQVSVMLQICQSSLDRGAG